MTPEQKALRNFVRKAKLGGEADSPKNKFLFENRNLTVKEYIAQFRAGGIKEVLPAEAETMTVEQVLRQGLVGKLNVRKLLIDLRDKFVK